MPITPPPQIPGLVNANGTAPFTQQYNFGQAIGNVLSWNPSCDIPQIQNFINDAVREWTDARQWYGNLQKGRIVTSGVFNTGSVTLTTGPASEQGIGTAWTQTLNGLPITQQ